MVLLLLCPVRLPGAFALVDPVKGVPGDGSVAVLTLVRTSGDLVEPQGLSLLGEPGQSFLPVEARGLLQLDPFLSGEGGASEGLVLGDLGVGYVRQLIPGDEPLCQRHLAEHPSNGGELTVERCWSWQHSTRLVHGVSRLLSP